MPSDDYGRLAVCLTFDFEEWEGRGRVYEADLYSKTKRIVDLLSEKDLPATFFLDGETVLKYPNAAGLLADGGFELALHSDRHPGGSNGNSKELDFGSQSSEKQVGRMETGIRMIRQVIPSFHPSGFRSPGLRWNEDLYHSLRVLGFSYDSSRLDKFAFQPFLKNGAVVLPVNCGDFDSACYKTRAQHVVSVWKDNFLRASDAAHRHGQSYYMLLAHPSVSGKTKYIGIIKTILGFMAWRKPQFLTCAELVSSFRNEDLQTSPRLS